MNVLNLFELDKFVKINIINRDMKFKVPCYTHESQSRYEIDISEKALYKFNMYKDELLQALILHEMAYIKFGSISFRSYKNELDFYIQNLVDGTRVEYLLSKEYPSVIKYFTLALELFKFKVGIYGDALDDFNINRNCEVEINKLFEQIHNFVRYDKIPDDDDLKDYIIPILVSSRKGDANHSKRCAGVIYRFFCYRIEELGLDVTDKTFSLENCYYDSVNFKDIELKIKELKEDNEKVKNEVESIDMEFEEFNKFVHDTIKKDIKNILAIENIFRKVLNKSLCLYFKEGEMPSNINKLQQLYMSSFTMEEEYVFTNKKIIETELDIIIIRDISYSTSSFKKQYAEMLIILLQAFSRFKYVRTASIDFSSNTIITKKFDQRIPDIVPKSMGMTNLAGAFNFISKEIELKSVNRLMILLTDGEPDNRQRAKQELKNDYFIGMKILPIIIKNDEVNLFDNQVHVNEIDEMPIEIYKFISREFRIGGAKNVMPL